MASATVKTKKKCCEDSPRCKRCPVVWKRLAHGGHAERTGKRTYHPVQPAPKSAMKSARAR